jgi:glucose/arabinose dehydrogenase
MRRNLLVAVAVTALTAATGAVAVGLVSPRHAFAQQSGGFNFSQPSVVATGLAIPWGLAFLPDGDAVVIERATARVLRIEPGSSPQQLGTLPNVDPDGEGGALGLAVSPSFAQDGWIYAYHTSPSDNRIVRFQLNSVGSPQSVLTGIPRGTQIHNGGRIQFGPDGMLYAATGDAGTGANAQNLNSLAGKILRMTATGGVPGGNPFAGSRVYSYGHRNVQGLAWDAQGRLWASEFGQNALDEVNLIQAGGNYGWPTCEGPCGNPGFINPKLTWPTSQSSPSGAEIANNHLFVAALRGQRLWVIPLQGENLGTPTSVLMGTFGRLRSVELGPDGWLWLDTSNRDGRGTPVPADDRVIRVPPTGLQTSSPPPSSPPPSSPPPTSSPPPVGTGGCTATPTIQSQWGTGYVMQPVTVTNTGSGSIAGWSVTFTLPSGHTLAGSWNAQLSGTGTITATNMPYNGNLGPGASTSFGFQVNRPNGNTQTPTSFACTVR